MGYRSEIVAAPWGLTSTPNASLSFSTSITGAENVPVPEQLRDPSGIKQLKDLLKDRFAKTRSLQLHCIKLACRWPDCRSPYANLLGWLTTLGDVEALGYQWQGQKDKIHNADRLLKQASQHCHVFFMMWSDNRSVHHAILSSSCAV